MALKVLVESLQYEVQGSYDPSDSWDRPDTNAEYIGTNVYFTNAQNPTGTMYGADFESDAEVGDKVYVVIAKYSTGDTFGHDGGQIDVMNVFKERYEADSLIAYLQSKKGNTYSCKFGGKDYYIPWNGYFETLEDLFIEECVVQKADAHRS